MELTKENGRYVVRIPEDGVLRMKGYDPFRSFLYTAAFSNGDPIWVEKRIDDVPQWGEVALRGLGTQIPSQSYWWFVGTDAERMADHASPYTPGKVRR
jgi:hypothetical protein